ncbi:MAG: hypothetical protein NTW21_41255 [Verrucomicrobia bacterium]|nr:hypothetical protein [Verrucomicrobiota bacterium]
MNPNPSSNDWFFPVHEAPIHATVTRNGVKRDVRVPHKKALVAADSGEILAFNTMTDIASHPPLSPRFRRDRPILERRAGAWLRDFTFAAAQPGFTIPAHLEKLAKPAEN